MAGVQGWGGREGHEWQILKEFSCFYSVDDEQPLKNREYLENVNAIKLILYLNIKQLTSLEITMPTNILCRKKEKKNSLF